MLSCLNPLWVRTLAGLLLCVMPAWAVQAQPGLPLRNLAVELRQVEAVSQTLGPGGGSAPRVVGSVSSANAPAGAVVYRTLPESGASTAAWAQQRVTVLNGQPASLRLTQAMLLQWMQVAWQSDGTVALLPGAVWAEAVHGFSVRPHWPGPGQPVRLDLGVTSSTLPVDPTSGQAGTQLHTTLVVPLGEWSTLAATVDERRELRSAPGVVDSRDAEARRRTLVQVRVTAP